MTELAITSIKGLTPEIQEAVEQVKKKIIEHHLSTFHRYRECGQIVLDTGYRKGKWDSKVRKWACEQWGIKKSTFYYFVQLGDMPEDEFSNVIGKFKSLYEWASQLCLPKPHVSQATGEDEWYTPEYIIEKVRQLMGTIDIDPASSDEANRIVKATKYYTEENDGLTQKWNGNVWMNPPYSQPLVTEFCNLLVNKYLIGEIKQACVLVNNATETAFYQNMLNHCKAVCFIKGRVKFVDEKGESTGAPLQGQTILYFGEDPENFGLIFSELGVVLYA